MRCPKCYTETANEALCCPGCKLPTPRGKSYLKSRGRGGSGDGDKPVGKTRSRKPAKQNDKKRVSPFIVVPVLLFGVLVFGLGSYIALTFWQEAQASDPGSLETVLNKVRESPSSQSGKTIDEYLVYRVKMSKEAGKLLETEGWNVTPITGKQFLVSFTYEEKGNHQHRAEWEVNLSSNTITAKNDLAAKVYRKD